MCEFNGFSFEQNWISITQGCFVSNLVEIGQVVLENIIKALSMHYHFSLIISPWKRVGPFIWADLNRLSPKDALCQVWLKLAQCLWSKRFFFISSMYFRFFVIIAPWKRAGPFISTNFNPLHPRMHSAKFGWNRPNGSGVEDFLISSMYFCYLVIISPLKRIGPFIWTNLNPLYRDGERCRTAGDFQ